MKKSCSLSVFPTPVLFTYHCLGILIKKDLFRNYENLITAVLLVFLVIFGVIFSDRLYTVVTFLTLAFVLAFARLLKVEWLSRFYFSYLVLLIPFSIVNGVLTGTGIQDPVVWYNSNEIMGLRVLTIPVEDIFYGMLLILLNVLIFETLKHLSTARSADSKSAAAAN